VGEAAQSGALLGSAAGIKGIDLHHPAKSVGLIAVVLGGIRSGGGGIEADELVRLVAGQLPAVARSLGAYAVALVLPGQVGLLVGAFAGVAEVARPVLLTGEVGIPGSDAVGAVVQSTPGHCAFRAELGFHEVGSPHWPLDLHEGKTGDAAVEAIPHHFPTAVSLLLDVDNAHPVAIQLFQHLVGIAGAVRIGGIQVGIQLLAHSRSMHKPRLDVLVVKHQQTLGGAALPGILPFDGEEVHAIVVAPTCIPCSAPVFSSLNCG